MSYNIFFSQLKDLAVNKNETLDKIYFVALRMYPT